MRRMREAVTAWGRRSPTSLALVVWGLLVGASYMHVWAPKAYAHFSSCQGPIQCSGGILSLGTVGFSQGGHGQTSQQEALDALIGSVTKGQIVVCNGTDCVTLAVGTDGQILEADAAEATGVKWATPTTGVQPPQGFHTTGMNLNGDSKYINIRSGMLCPDDAAGADYCAQGTQVAYTISNLTCRANKDIGGTDHKIEIAQGSCTAAPTFDCQSGDLCVTVASTSSDTPTAADTDSLTVTAGNCAYARVTATGDTADDVVHACEWQVTG